MGFLLLSAVAAYAQPSIRFYEEFYDAGEVQEGEKIEHTFEFTNEGRENLIIERLHPS